MKNAIDKLLFQKGSYNHDTVKTNFSKLVLDEVSESSEGKSCSLFIMLHFAISAVRACLLQFIFSV